MLYISGAFGGVSPAGDISANFYYERRAIPKSQVFSVLENGRLDELPLKEEKRDSIIRNVLFGISMSPNVARGIARWLDEKADEFDRIHSIEKSEEDK